MPYSMGILFHEYNRSGLIVGVHRGKQEVAFTYLLRGELIKQDIVNMTKEIFGKDLIGRRASVRI